MPRSETRIVGPHERPRRSLPLARTTRLGVAALGALVPDRPVPLFASLEVTRRCPGRCAYCAAPKRGEVEELPTQEWIAILDDLARSGCLAVSFTGGEPLVRNDLGALMDHGRRLGLRVFLNTSGFGLPEREAWIRLADRVTVSLDGVREVQDRLRGAGAFDRAMEVIETCRRHRVPMQCNAVISRTAIARLPEFLDLLRRIGLPVQFQPAYDELLRSADATNPEAPDAEALHQAAVQVRRARRLGLAVQNDAEDLDLWARIRQDNVPRCLGGRWFVRVTHRGHLEVCGIRPDPSPPGIRARDGIRQGMARILDRPNPCRRCPSASRAAFNRLASGAPGPLGRRVWGYLRKITRIP